MLWSLKRLTIEIRVRVRVTARVRVRVTARVRDSGGVGCGTSKDYQLRLRCKPG